MTIRDRLKRLLDDGVLVELFFAPANSCYLARVTRVGQDYVEFDAYDEEENLIAHNIMPLGLITGITTTSMERSRERFEMLFKKSEPSDGTPRTSN